MQYTVQENKVIVCEINGVVHVPPLLVRYLEGSNMLNLNVLRR